LESCGFEGPDTLVERMEKTMTDDPIVAEIRAIREAYARRFNY
jgi:hypothetical protein